MSLALGTRLGPYEITESIGAGGMGEVYRARDTRLVRDVAIKVLPASVAADGDRRARFEREMQAVAALSHPNVLAIFDTGLHDGQLFAVAELLKGQTLRDRLGTALPPRKAIEIAIQVARGLAAAHAKGLVHRDLKPENIFLLEDGQVKILDFGLVRQVGSDAASGATQTIARTDAGIVMGTIGYMAPEQVRGQAVDARADLFALGAVLYEMLSGRRAFGRQTPADSMTAILTEEPPDLAASVVDASPAVDRIVRHCLEKNPAERFQTARDVAFALESLTGSGRLTSSASEPLPSAVGRRPQRSATRWGVAAVAAVLLVAAGWFGGRAAAPTAPPGSATWASLAPPFGHFAPFAGPAISPDGMQVAFWAPDERQRTVLWIRRLDSPNSRQVPGTEVLSEVYQPFWAPDGKAVAFFGDGKMKRVSLDGGAPQALADVTTPRGGSWGRDGRIIYSPVSAAGVYTIPETGGTPSLVAISDSENRPLQYPSFLPDAQHYLITCTNGGIFLGSIDNPVIRKVADARSRVEYSAGHLFFEQGGGLYAQPFDLTRFETTGAPVRLSTSVGFGLGSFIDRTFSVSEAGRLVFTDGTWQPPAQLTWFDRSGKVIRTVGGVSEIMGVVVSKDRTRALSERHDSESNFTGPWVVDLMAGTEARLAPAQSESIELTPTWSADESRVFFSTLRGIYARQVRGGQVERLLAQDRTVWLNDRSEDGRYLLFEKGDPATQGDVWVLTLNQPVAARPLVATKYNEGQGRLSPDARTLAFVSDESGRREVYLDSFPELQTKIPVSVGGGTMPEWRPDGRELYYLAPDGMLMAAPVVATGGAIRAGRPVKLFQITTLSLYNNRHQYHSTTAGDRFLVSSLLPKDLNPPLTVLFNWPALVGKVRR